MNEQNQSIDILDIMIQFFQGFVNTYFEGREDVALYQKKKKLTLYIPNEDKTDATYVRCTRLDESTVSVTVYHESNPNVKLYMGYYNKTCNDPDQNEAKLSKLSVDISVWVFGPQVEPEQKETDHQIKVNIEDIVRVTSVETVKVMEHHVLAVSFDGQEPVNLSVPKEQLSIFTMGNKLVKMPFGFQYLETNPVVH